ncbi:Outer membrane protein TolC [Marivirga sericea]|uniref:Outer membrane protein TolC n=1 Tax=Marivirga sericea TaxID=1028 RepID=A0A1X7IB04_9BACT|nr:TolC family protein [Marivirga sericea]SMG11445.1 Outer membrane protein TolC [Marivirga sericea]
MLNKIRIFCVLFAFMPLGAIAQEEMSKPMSLEECVNYALDNNRNLKSTRLQENIAETQVGETRSMGLPQVKFQTGLNYNYEVQKAFLPNEILGNPEPGFTPVQFSPEYDGNAAFSISQLLFDGSYFVGLQAAKTLRELRQKESNQSEVQTVEAITKAYYLVLITEERLKLLNANQEQLERVLNETKALYENGFAEKIDVDRINVNYNNIQTENNKAKRSFDVSKDMLKFQMGMPINSPLELSGSISNLTLEAEEYMNKSENFNYRERSEYSILQVNQDLANLDLRNNKATHLPKLYANFNYGWNSGVNGASELFEFSNNWLSFGAIGVSLQWDLFTGLNRSSKMEKNRIQIEQIEIQKEQLKSSIDMEIKRAKDDLTSAKESMDVQKQNMELALSVYEQIETKYKNGLASSRELLDAETAKKEAETNYYSSLYDAVIAKIELEKALGILY